MPNTPVQPSADGLSPTAMEKLQCYPRRGYIRIKIIYGSIFQLFDMKEHTPLGVALDMFSKKINQEKELLYFHHEGGPMRDTDTPSSLEMDELDALGNIIEANVMQVCSALLFCVVTIDEPGP
ncbi:hypothetical protein B0H17DRAFT_1202563 [Mycena rosella]|uniref:Uncharacterized protein n=1 Tax=Mycena rosella TaxID=1033263 RepID=A0AAD7DDV8_MYCRO|nr:hypothetical protein B0H17DRAFT_1202563 [Mycena rosella]